MQPRNRTLSETRSVDTDKGGENQIQKIGKRNGEVH
jgi:hypothetical protein